ncbi:MAG: FtsW/RodA/SpoVE family cell cycle protein [Phycisphaerae bacterium]
MKPRRVLNLTQLGWGLAVPVLMLSAFGLTSIHATDRSAANVVEVDQPGRVALADANWLGVAVKAIGPLTLRQGLYLITGIGLLFLVLVPSYRRIGRHAYFFYGLVVFLLLLLFLDRYVDLPLVPVKRDVRRWIELGAFSIQPSEFMKVGLILALAYYLRYRKSYRTWRGLVPPFLLTLLPMVLILKQPDLGTLLMLLPVLFVMLFVAGARLRHLMTIVVLGCATLPLFYFFGMEDYQRDRIRALFKQNTEDETWHMKQGYQLRQSLIALGTGGLAGEGYGEGAIVRYGLLPEERNDFIFAVVGNQWGFVGCVVVILAYVVIIICGLEVAMVTNEPFGRLLAVGVVVMIVVQALLNICMNLGLAPITGMTLPFVSAGGSSLWANFLALGLLVNVAQRRPMLIAHPPFEHRDD